MIRHTGALDDIDAAVEASVPGWPRKAAARTRLFAERGGYCESYPLPSGRTRSLKPFWGEVKPLFLVRQFNKCVYCETQLERGEDALLQWDLEHFRPKSNVRRWTASHDPELDTGPDDPGGYYLLAYHLRNYAVSCKTCNSPFKSDYFPVAAARVAGRPHPAEYGEEKPYLIYPLGGGEGDPADPEQFITFHGHEARPRPRLEDDPAGWRRARVMIDFFGLNRDGLAAARAQWLRFAVWSNYLSQDAASVEFLRSPRAPFTSCTRCFLALCEADEPAARALLPGLEQAAEFLQGGGA
jgi:hypothetical protein